MQLKRRTRPSTGRAFMTALEPRRLFAAVPTGFVDTLLGGPTQLTTGTAFEFAPDGRIFVLQQTGTVRIFAANGSPVATPALTLTVDSSGERGLLGIAFDPNFGTTNNFVYLYYTTTSGGSHNRVSRFTVTGNTINAGSESVLMNLDALSSQTNHNGGAIHFGKDGMLYVAVGDNANSANAQNVTNRLGKILRINSDGTIPDNPTSFKVRPTSSTAYTTVTPTGANTAIWAVGFRNPYTFSTDKITGQILINDVGEVTWEEINELSAGKNYGWPRTEGDFSLATPGNEELTRPIYSYVHASGGFPNGYAISGGATYAHSLAPQQFPALYQGKYFFGDYVNDWIGFIDPAAPPAANGATRFATAAYGIVDLKLGPDGAVYYLGRDQDVGNAGVHKIAVNPTSSPSVTGQPASVTVNAGTQATFTATASGPNITGYQWTRNGVDIPGAVSSTYTIPSAQSAENGAVFRFKVLGTGGIALSNAATLTVIPDNVAPLIVNKVFDRNDPQHRVTITFSEPILSGTGTVALNNTLTSAPVPFSSIVFNSTTKTLVVTPNSRLSDGRYRLTMNGLTDLAGNTLAASSFDFLFLNSDATGDGVVNFDDLVPLAQNYNKTAKTFSEGDFDYSGNVNFDDLVILAMRYNLSLPDAPMLSVAKADVGKTGPSKFKARAVDGLV